MFVFFLFSVDKIFYASKLDFVEVSHIVYKFPEDWMCWNEVVIFSELFNKKILCNDKKNEQKAFIENLDTVSYVLVWLNNF